MAPAVNTATNKVRKQDASRRRGVKGTRFVVYLLDEEDERTGTESYLGTWRVPGREI